MDVRAALAAALNRPDLTTAEAMAFVERLRVAGYALVPRGFFDELDRTLASMRNAADGYRAPSPAPGPRPAGFRSSIREE